MDLNDDSEDRRQFRDRRIPTKLLPLLAQGRVRSIAEPYCLISLPPGSDRALYGALAECEIPFSSVSSDDREVSAVLPEATWRELAGRFPEHRAEKGFRVLAIEGDSTWNEPGYVQVIGRVLAEGGIGAGVICGSRRLHIVVKSSQAKDARIQLDLLASQARGRLGGRGRGDVARA